MGNSDLDMIRYFPPSAEAATCLPQLYTEALAASQVCAFNSKASVSDAAAGLGVERCRCDARGR